MKSQKTKSQKKNIEPKKNNSWQKKVILLLILLSILLMARNILLRESIEWDEAVNIGMGKHIFSNGKMGLWEDQRPVILPIIFGVIWKIGLDPFLFGKIVMVISTLICILLVYLTGKKIFNKETGMAAAALLSFSLIFIHHSSLMMSNLPSATFILASVYMLAKKNYVVAGIFAALAFMTRFTGGIIFIAAILSLAILFIITKKIKTKSIVLFIAGFIILVLPYLILNGAFYSETTGSFLSGTVWPMNWASKGAAEGAPYLFTDSKLFYLKGMLTEFLAAMFLIPAAYFFLKERKFLEAPALTAASALIAFFVYYMSVTQNTLRYITDFIPLVALFTAYGFTSLQKKAASSSQKTIVTIIIMACLVFSLIASGFGEQLTHPEYGRTFEIYKNNQNIKSPVLTSDPSAAYFTDEKIVPAFTVDRFIFAMDKEEYSFVIYIPDFLVCHDVIFSKKETPYNELISTCPEKKKEILKILKEKYELYTNQNGEYYFIKKT